MNKLEKLRKVEMELLEQFIKICEREHLTWYAICGTLLGTVRDSGFLIWDDDIDVAMPEDDYKALMMHKEWFEEPFVLQTPVDTGNGSHLFKNGTTAFCKPLFDCIKQGGHQGICIDILRLSDIGDTGYYCIMNKTIPKSYFEPGVTSQFEYLDVKIPNQPRKVLDLLYGYWQWPAGAQIIRPHYWFYDTETDYQVYMERYSGWLKDLDKKKIYLFGAADSLRIWLRDFGSGKNVVCTYDNDPSKWGKKAFGVDVCNPEKISQTLDDDSILIITSIWHKEIGEQLQSMGISKYYVFLDQLFINEFKIRGVEQ